MMTSEIKSQISFDKSHLLFVDPFLKQFFRTTKAYTCFHLLFFFIGITELLIFLLLFPFLAHSALLAVTFAALFLTTFIYLTLRIYFQTQKPDQFRKLLEQYVMECKNSYGNIKTSAEYHVHIAQACSKLASSLQGKEYEFYKVPRWLDFLTPFIEKFSCWWHWYDLHTMKEMLLKRSVHEHIQMVKSEPTNLEFHAALANAYVMLSGLYIDPRKIEGFDDDDRWIPHNHYSSLLKDKFRSTAKKAIEEFKILSEYAPNDPWVHTQLAYSYHDLQMPEEETHEYEIILKLRPNDSDILYKLGTLYFQQGRNARGLQIYEELKTIDYKKAEDLIQHYAN
jgi:tetratricopeptide (TPR) repeat protein